MKHLIFWGITAMALFTTACRKDNAQPVTPFSFDFNQQSHGWVAGFADYTDAYENLQLEGKIAPLPAEINPSLKANGYKVQGDNQPDDLFMFLKRKVTGLEPNTPYAVEISVEVASNAPRGAVGIGGAPGEAVFFKAGATVKEPVSAKNTEGRYLMNIDKGNQGQGGADMKIIGNAANGSDKERYVTLKRKATDLRVTTNDKGECWLIVGTDSGYEGMTVLYYQNIAAKFRSE
jgi:hypothetical protein